MSLQKGVIGRTIALVAVALIAILSGCATTGQTNATGVEKDADQLLREMSDALASTQQFLFDTEERHSTLDRNGKLTSRFLSRRVLVHRPDAARVRVTQSGGQREIWLNNGVLVMADHGENVFSTIDVPVNLDECMDYLAAELQIPMPMSDILYSSPYDALVASGTRGGIVGRAFISGYETHHLSLTHQSVDWEIWIRAEGLPLPVRMKIRQKGENRASESILNFRNWNLDVEVGSGVFDFKPPEGYESIPVRLTVAGLED